MDCGDYRTLSNGRCSVYGWIIYECIIASKFAGHKCATILSLYLSISPFFSHSECVFVCAHFKVLYFV